MVKSSTRRVQEHRKRKKIAEISEFSRWISWFVRMHYQSQTIPLTTFVPALDLYTKPVDVQGTAIDIKVFFRGEEDFLRASKDVGIDRKIVRIDQKDVVIIRPKFLREELNP
jgi:hypothetical protein